MGNIRCRRTFLSCKNGLIMKIFMVLYQPECCDFQNVGAFSTLEAAQAYIDENIKPASEEEIEELYQKFLENAKRLKEGSLKSLDKRIREIGKDVSQNLSGWYKMRERIENQKEISREEYISVNEYSFFPKSEHYRIEEWEVDAKCSLEP